MSLLHLEALPPRTTKGTIVRLLVQVGGLDRQKIGKIEVRGRAAAVEVPARLAAKLAKALDGANLANRHIRAWAAAETAGGEDDDHFAQLLAWMDLEAAAEAQQTLRRLNRSSAQDAEASGLSLVALVLRDAYAGLGGRTLVTLSKSQPGGRLPWTRLNVGSPVLLSEEGARRQEGIRGVVSSRGDTRIQVATGQWPQSSDDRATWRLDLSGDETARQRQRMALERARAARGDRLSELRAILLGERSPAFGKPQDVATLDEALNPSQQQAVQFALTAEDLAIIHGPPGTGKTTTVVELIRQAVAEGHKVLACAPSNMGVDNLFERLLRAGEKAVRLGHPARVLPELREHTLDLIVEKHHDVRLARKLVREAYALRDKAARFTRAKPAPGERREMRREATDLLADARRLEAQVVQQVLDSADILCATTTGLDSEILGQRSFDLTVIDEACQSTEPGCWIPLLRCQRLVLAGDHCQLPPTVVSRQAASEGFATSLMERLIHLHTPEIARQLTVQYRMNESIMQFPSAEFYENSLEAHPSVREHLLADLEGLESCELTVSPVHFIDTAGAGYEEQLEPDGESRLNPGEADIVFNKVQALLAAGLAPRDLAVITPYSAQARLLRDRLAVDGLEVDSVDGFQGREKEAVIISLVRSNLRGEIGFLADVRRMNVALTRARRKLIVIGDSATISGDDFYGRMLEHFERIGAYHTVWEEM